MLKGHPLSQWLLCMCFATCTLNPSFSVTEIIAFVHSLFPPPSNQSTIDTPATVHHHHYHCCHPLVVVIVVLPTLLRDSRTGEYVGVTALQNRRVCSFLQQPYDTRILPPLVTKFLTLILGSGSRSSLLFQEHWPLDGIFATSKT